MVFPSPRTFSFNFTLYNQTLALSVSAGFLWHVRCDVPSWQNMTSAPILGLVYATLVEHAALATGRWSYTERMPVVTILGAGLWPLLQMTLLPPLTFWIARWWTCRSATNGDFYDEPY
jgi:hypothetical protein